jgi:3-hydroxyisobutyrate dehydrogenase-like beta-hydroxyacid dehydrogenase
MTKVAFCGLGLLGGPIALRLVDAGFDVTVWNRTPEKSREAVSRGASKAATPEEAAAGADVAITVLSTPQALNEVVLGPAGLAGGLGGGSILMDMSTVGPEPIRELATGLPEGVELVDAPVLGSVPQATEGTLKIFVGGSPQAYDRLRTVFDVLGSPRHIGPLGSGAAMKLVVNSTLGPVMAALGEALALADLLGLDPSTVLDVLEGSAVGTAAKGKRGRIESGEYEPNFRLALARKDSDLVTRAAGDRLPVAHTVRQLFAEAERAGLGNLDYSAVVKLIRERVARSEPGVE